MSMSRGFSRLFLVVYVAASIGGLVTMAIYGQGAGLGMGTHGLTFMNWVAIVTMAAIMFVGICLSADWWESVKLGPVPSILMTLCYFVGAVGTGVWAIHYVGESASGWLLLALFVPPLLAAGAGWLVVQLTKFLIAGFK